MSTKQWVEHKKAILIYMQSGQYGETSAKKIVRTIKPGLNGALRGSTIHKER